MSNLVRECLVAHSAHEHLKQLPRVGSTGGVQRNRKIWSAWLESSYSSKQMLPLTCTHDFWHRCRRLTRCLGLEDKLNGLRKVSLISPLGAEVAKKPSEETSTWFLSQLTCSGWLVAAGRRIIDLSALYYWCWICFWFKADGDVLCVSH